MVSTRLINQTQDDVMMARLNLLALMLMMEQVSLSLSQARVYDYYLNAVMTFKIFRKLIYAALISLIILLLDARV